jgi:HlyD family secretion protein
LIRYRGIASLAPAGLASLLLLSACGASSQAPASGAPGAQAKPAGPPPAPVATAKVDRGPIKAGLTFTGDVTASKQINLAPKVAGLVVKLMADVGSEVKTGQPLAELDHVTQDAAAAQAQAQVEVAKAALGKVQAQGRPEEVAKAQAVLAQQQARLDALQNQGRPEAVGQAQAKLEQDTHQLDNDRAALESAKAKLAVVKSPQQIDSFRQAAATAQNTLYSNQIARDVSCAGIGNGPAPATGKGGSCQAAQAAVNSAQTALDQANDNLAINVDPNTTNQVVNAVKQAQATLDKDTALVQADQQALALAKNPNTTQDIGAQQAVVNQANQSLREAARPFVDTDIQSAQASVDAAQANLDVAKVNQQLTQVMAPFDGVVSARLLAEGALASTTVPIFTIVSRDVEVDLPVAQEQLSQIKSGQAAQLSTPSLGGQTIDGKIATISPAADPKSRTFLVRVVPAVQDGKLMPGMSASVLIDTVEKPDVVLLPADAVTTDANTNAQGVYVVQNTQNGQTVSFKTPSLGVTDGKMVEVLNGINAGDLVVVSGQTSLVNNQRVRVTSGGEAAGGSTGASGAPQASPGASGKPQASGGGRSSGKPQASAAG